MFGVEVCKNLMSKELFFPNKIKKQKFQRNRAGLKYYYSSEYLGEGFTFHIKMRENREESEENNAAP